MLTIWWCQMARTKRVTYAIVDSVTHLLVGPSKDIDVKFGSHFGSAVDRAHHWLRCRQRRAGYKFWAHAEMP